MNYEKKILVLRGAIMNDLDSIGQIMKESMAENGHQVMMCQPYAIKKAKELVGMEIDKISAYLRQQQTK